MSRFREVLDEMQNCQTARKAETVVNFMGGESYEINPLDTLKMITASSIFGEPSYYRCGVIGHKMKDAYFKANVLLGEYLAFKEICEGKSTTQIMEEAIDAALEYDFEGVLRWAVTLRQEFYMRLNPQVIMVRAALHPGRSAFTGEHPGVYDEIEQQVMYRADDALSQLAYFLYINKGKNNMPSLLKRSLAKKLASLNEYEMAKYKNAEMGMKDAVCITHASSPVIDQYMKTGTVTIPEEKMTWERLRSEGRDWKDIFYTVSMGHMALLRNVRGVFEEIPDQDFGKDYLERLKKGVENGRQFPYRYYNAHQMIKKSDCAHKMQILDTLEECMDISMVNLPKLKGRTMCLSDNSGSAWGAIPSEYGEVTVAVIDNLSSVIAAAASDEGYVGKFGDTLKVYPISKRQGILHQCEEISRNGGNDVGYSTEGGIWEFFSKAIDQKEHWDHIFIYSDMQAGHGGLYGTDKQFSIYNEKGYACRGNYINVFELLLEYRRKVNPKVNVYSIQTAGYNNVVVPEYAYRTSILYGWTGKELIFAEKMNALWDKYDFSDSGKK